MSPGLDLAACYSQKCEWVFQIFPFLRVIKSITRKFLRVDLILIIDLQCESFKICEIKTYSGFSAHIFPANCVKNDSRNRVQWLPVSIWSAVHRLTVCAASMRRSSLFPMCVLSCVALGNICIPFVCLYEA